jgi:hypothetical protein
VVVGERRSVLETEAHVVGHRRNKAKIAPARPVHLAVTYQPPARVHGFGRVGNGLRHEPTKFVGDLSDLLWIRSKKPIRRKAAAIPPGVARRLDSLTRHGNASLLHNQTLFGVYGTSKIVSTVKTQRENVVRYSILAMRSA